ncbi:MAG: arylsulfatase [Zavarzinella sp.]
MLRLSLWCFCLFTLPLLGAERPNIVLIYADDLGYGDLSCYGATAVKTPNVDRLAKEGLRFTDAHSPSATCTPSRYAMLTGQYAWRKAGTGILPGTAPLIIPQNKTNMATILQSAGYTTGVVGKWHLGLGDGTLDWNKAIRPGPKQIGFDYHFLIPATGDRVPCVYVENEAVANLDKKDPIEVSFGKPVGMEPTGVNNPDLLRIKPSHGHNQTIINGISRIGYMSGGKSARWVDEDMADVITGKAVDFVEKNHKKPFFLFFSLHDIHVPRTPHRRFVGNTTMGPRGDVIAQMDWCTGEILQALDRLKLTDNTLVIFTSDNGPVVDDGYQDDAVAKLGNHRPAGPLRGGKYSNFEGGTRVPMLVRWPQKVKPGTSDALLAQVDFPATLAALTEQKVTEADAPDSFNLLPALLGETKKGREHLIEHASVLSVRMGNWKMIPPGKGKKVLPNTAIESGLEPQVRLYNLSKDLGETTNVAKDHPQVVAEMQALLKRIQTAGRSR